MELLQRELNNAKAPNDIRYQRAPIPPTMIQLTGEQEQQLWDLGVGINPYMAPKLFRMQRHISLVAH